MPSNALVRALNGERVAGPAASGALKEAVAMLDRNQGAFARLRQSAAETSRVVIHEGEAVAALAAGSYAEGYYGADKLKIMGKVDGRAVLGVGLMLIGHYRRNRSDGRHLYHVGQGAAHSVIAMWAVNQGRRMAAKSGSNEAIADKGTNAPVTSADGDPVAAFMREVHLQSEPAPGVRAHRA